MAINQFADLSKDLYMQIKIIENLTKGGEFKEAVKLLSTAEKDCGSLEAMIEIDNKVQTHIVSNRRQEISWLQDTIQHALVKTPATRRKKHVTK